MPDGDEPTQDLPAPGDHPAPTELNEAPPGAAHGAAHGAGPPPPRHDPPDRHALLRAGRIALQIAVLCGIGWLVWHELKAIDLRTAAARLHGASRRDVALAIGAAVLALAMMGLYDVAAFPASPTLRARRRWILGVLFFSWTNFLTLGPIGGPALRLFVYRRHGLGAPDIVRGMLRIYAGNFAGIASWVVAAVLPLGDTTGASAGRVGAALLCAPALGVLIGRLARRFRSVSGADLSDLRAAGLGVLGAADWGVAISVFVFCGRATEQGGAFPSVSELMRTMTFGHAVGFVSMIPGGLGSADAVWLKMLTTYGAGPNEATAHILLFRLVYYLMPWTGSLLVLYARFSGASDPLLRWQRRLLAAAVAVNAGLLLASAATPSIRERLQGLQERLGVPVDAVEASHALAVVSAVVMVFLIRGLLRGYRAAFIVTGITLASSAAAHLLKGGDFEEALVSLLLLALLVGSRRGFTRRGRIPIGWEVAMGATVGTLTFFMLIGLAAFPRVRASDLYELYDRAMQHPEGARVVRGVELIAAVGLIFLLRQAVVPRRIAVTPSQAEIDEASALIARLGEHATGLNVGAGDKGAWFWRPQRDAEGVVLYQRRHRKLVVFSDPVVDARRAADLLEEFHAFARDEDLDVVFYQISGAWMEHLHDFGYTFFKLGEEAIVDLPSFTLDGGAGHGFRKSIRRVEGQGVRFEVLHPPHDRALIDEARTVSDAWLASRGVQEMQFSLGYFAPEYLQRHPLGIVRDSAGRLVGFLNVLGTRHGTPVSPGGEVTYDLLRYEQGVEGLSEYMLLRLLDWGRGRGFATLNLGMSPLFDVGEYRRAPIPERLARLMFEHGERIYSYRGLHAFKEKFRPVWQARFMAYQRPWDWPSAVLSTTSLIWARTPQDRRRLEQARSGC
jgi:phosphatidylglycerol lysyltransferase